MYHRKICLLVIFFIFSIISFAQADSNKDVFLDISVPEHAYDGDPFFVSVKSSDARYVIFTWDKKKLRLEPGNNGQSKYTCEAMFFIPFKSKKKSMPLDIIIGTHSGEIHKVKNIPIIAKEYPIQRLKVKQKFVTPPNSVKNRITQEIALQKKTYSIISSIKYWSFPFTRPVSGVVTSKFGLRRFFNNEERNPHKGVDFDASKGDAILAAESGIVALTGDFYYNGNTIIIDHGLGIFTSYMHLSQINVKIGQKISRGEIIGLVGSSGRVTGPHLHLSMYVFGNSVNAAQALEGMLE